MSEPNDGSFAGALDVLREFVDANARGDEAAMRSLLSKRTLETGSFTGAQNQDAVFSFGEARSEGEAVIIPLRLRPAGADESASQELPAVMIREDGAWKFDLAGTMDRLMGGFESAMQEAAGQMASAMGEAMEGIAGAMREAFGGEGEEGADSWDHVPAEPGPDELHPVPEMVALERTEREISTALGFQVSVRADIKGLLALLNSDDAAMLSDWLQDRLLNGWAPIFASIGEGMPLEGRLHGARIEVARSAEDRFIAADLNDVVYRMYPAQESGYYSDDEVSRVMPGVLAGMGTPVNPSSGTASVFGEGDVPSVEQYGVGEGARCMRRISEMVGRSIWLQVDWAEMGYIPLAGAMLMRWGLGRAVGGVALALAGARADEVKAELRAIRLSGVYTPGERRLAFDDGVLEMAIAPSAQEAGCFWEADIAAALEGQPIGIAVEDADEHSFEEVGSGEEEDDGVKEEEPAEEESDDEEVTNDTLFRDGVAGIGEVVPTWEMQLEMALGHKTALKVDWDSLGGEYALVQGMVHVGVVQSLAAISAVGFDPTTKQALSERVESVRIEHRAGAPRGSRVRFEGGELVFGLDMSEEVAGPPDGSLDEELRHVLAAPVGAETRAGRALGYMARLEGLMREENLWPGDPPAGPIEVRGAFGCENMAFAQWLAWVLIPRVKEIAASGGSFPAGSSVGAYAVRELDGAGADRVVSLLCEFDRFVESGAT